MTDKTTAWFDRKRKELSVLKDHGRVWTSIVLPYGATGLLAVLGRVIYTNARVNGKSKRVRVWIP